MTREPLPPGKGFITQTSETTSVHGLIESFGPSSTYMLCDGIPRVSWLGSRNKTTTRWVTQQLTVFKSRIGVTDEALAAADVPQRTRRTATMLNTTTESTLGNRPTCTLALGTCNWLNEAYHGVEAEDLKLHANDAVAERIILQACPMWKDCEMKTGEEIVVLYWPERVSKDVCALNGYGTVQALSSRTRPSKSLNFTPNITVTAITFRGKDIYGPYNTRPFPAAIDSLKKEFVGTSVLYGNWTLFSPTVYIAHHPITFSVTQKSLLGSGLFDKVSVEQAYSDAVLPAGVLPVRAEDVSSVYSVVDGEATGLAWVTNVINGRYMPYRFKHGPLSYSVITTRLNFNHLSDPVPASIYFKARSDCHGNVTHCSTITDDSYRAKLYINHTIWQRAMPSGLGCRLPPLVDPASGYSVVGLDEPEEPEVHLPKLATFPAAEPTPDYGRNPNGLLHIGARPGGRGAPPHPRPTGQPPRGGSGSTDPRASPGELYSGASVGGGDDWNHRPGYKIHPSSDHPSSENGGRKGWLGGGRNDGRHRSGRDESVLGGHGETGERRGPGNGAGSGIWPGIWSGFWSGPGAVFGSETGGGKGGSTGSTDRRSGRVSTGAAAADILPHSSMWAIVLFGGLWGFFG